VTCCCCAIGRGTGLGGVVGLGRIGEGVWWMTVDGNGYGAASLPGWGCCCMVGFLQTSGLGSLFFCFAQRRDEWQTEETVCVLWTVRAGLLARLIYS